MLRQYEQLMSKRQKMKLDRSIILPNLIYLSNKRTMSLLSLPADIITSLTHYLQVVELIQLSVTSTSVRMFVTTRSAARHLNLDGKNLKNQQQEINYIRSSTSLHPVGLTINNMILGRKLLQELWHGLGSYNWIQSLSFHLGVLKMYADWEPL